MGVQVSLLERNLSDTYYSEDQVMAASERAAESMEGIIVSQAQGLAFVMEQGRIGMLEGKVGYREGLTHRIIGESGGGQSRAHLPAGQGGVPTAI